VCAAVGRASGWRSAHTTRAPAKANLIAMVRPNPDDDLVITAIRPCRRPSCIGGEVVAGCPFVAMFESGQSLAVSSSLRAVMERQGNRRLLRNVKA
jgi:hypothetical protein